jgi:hypothetical protein
MAKLSIIDNDNFRYINTIRIIAQFICSNSDVYVYIVISI